MYSLYQKKKEEADRLNAEILAKRRALLNLSPRSKDRRLKSIYGLTRNEMANRRLARLEKFMSTNREILPETEEDNEKEVNVRFVTGAGESDFNFDLFDEDSSAPTKSKVVVVNKEKLNINRNLRGTIYENYPEEPGLHDYRIRSRNIDKELQDHPKNGWISANIYVPRAVYKGGGALDCPRTKELLGFTKEDDNCPLPSGTVKTNQSSPTFVNAHNNTSSSKDFDSIYVPGKKEHIVSTTFPIENERRGKLVDGLLPRRCTSAPVDIASIRGRNPRGKYTGAKSMDRLRVKSAEMSSEPFYTVVRGNPNGVFNPPSPRAPGSEFDLDKLKGTLGYYKNDSMKYSSYKEVDKSKWKANTFRLIVKNPKGGNRDFTGKILPGSLNASESFVEGASCAQGMRGRNALLDIDQSNIFSTAVPQDIRLPTNYQKIRTPSGIAKRNQKYEYAITMKKREYPQMKLYKASLIGAKK